MFTPIVVPQRGNPLFGQQVETAISGLAQFILDYNELTSILNGAITGISSTSLSIATGTKSPVVESGLNLVPGYPVRLAYITDPTKYMDGVVLTYDDDTGQLVCNISSVAGSGTYANWQIMVLPAAGDYASKGANKFTGLQTGANEVTVASASSINLTAADSNQVQITGTTSISGVTLAQGAEVVARAAGAFTLVNSSSLIIQGGADYICTVGDIINFIKDVDGNIHAYISPIDGRSIIDDVVNLTNDSTLASNSAQKQVSPEWGNKKYLIQQSVAQALSGAAAYDFTVPAGVKRVWLHLSKVSLSTGDTFLVQLGTSSGIETTGYDGGITLFAANTVDPQTLSSGIAFVNNGAASTNTVIIPLVNIPGTNTWVSSFSISNSTGRGCNTSCSKDLAGALTTVRLTRSGSTGLYDAGSGFVSWEF